MDEIIWMPTDLEEERASVLCDMIIDSMEGERLEMKAFVLQTLITSFEEAADIKLSAIIHKDE